jgi:hypothetical protein
MEKFRLPEHIRASKIEKVLSRKHQGVRSIYDLFESTEKNRVALQDALGILLIMLLKSDDTSKIHSNK